MDNEIKKHWETIYETKMPHEVSWTQELPKTSSEFIHSFHLDKSANIIDVGGGDSRLADCLLEEGYEHITVLDISGKVIERAKQRLGSLAEKVNWIETDIITFEPKQQYDLWHDRAVFNFLTKAEQVEQYKQILCKAVSNYLIMGTYSKEGPAKCSGLTIQQYNAELLSLQFKNTFKKITCIQEDHLTPFSTLQNFLFCSFRRQKNICICQN